ncbi:hypothetical protein [Metabacillus fastidiosus]|uniref:hypothetical protein n=1 Tax=Metabacillus fastidiosus TaxID=1458 RepID=UPI003D2CF8F7
MNNYFEEVTSNLSFTDLSILGHLADHEANTLFKSIKKKVVQDVLKLTEANLRKSLYRLQALKFIVIETSEKEHSVYITNFGQQALYISFSEEVE